MDSSFGVYLFRIIIYYRTTNLSQYILYHESLGTSVKQYPFQIPSDELRWPSG